jgi:hypothetical protein
MALHDCLPSVHFFGGRRGVAVVADLVAIFYLHFLSSVTLMLTMMMMMMMYILCALYDFAMRTFCDAVVNGRAEKVKIQFLNLQLLYLVFGKDLFD